MTSALADFRRTMCVVCKCGMHATLKAPANTLFVHRPSIAIQYGTRPQESFFSSIPPRLRAMSSAWQVDTEVDSIPRAVRPPPKAACTAGPPAEQIYSRSSVNEPTFARRGSETSIAERLDIIDGIHNSKVCAWDEGSPPRTRGGNTCALEGTGSPLATSLASVDHDETLACQVMEHHPQRRAEHLRSTREQFVRHHEAGHDHDMLRVSPTPSSSMKDLCSLLHSSSLKQGTHFAIMNDEDEEDKSSGSMSQGSEECGVPETPRLRPHAFPPPPSLSSPPAARAEHDNLNETNEEAFEACWSPRRLRPPPRACRSTSAAASIVPDGSTPQAVYHLRLG